MAEEPTCAAVGGISAEEGGEAAANELGDCIFVTGEGGAGAGEDYEVVPPSDFLSPQGADDGYAVPWAAGGAVLKRLANHGMDVLQALVQIEGYGKAD